jgi:hypothetical protein
LKGVIGHTLEVSGKIVSLSSKSSLSPQETVSLWGEGEDGTDKRGPKL